MARPAAAPVADARCANTGTRRSATLSLLAATAKLHGLTLATRTVTDVLETGVGWINPWVAA